MNDDVISEWKLSGNAAFIPQKKVGPSQDLRVFKSFLCVIFGSIPN